MNSGDPILELFLSYKKTGALHHAYLFEMNDSAPLLTLIDEHLVPTRGNQDFWHGTYDSFGIDESRLLKEMQQNRPSAGEKKIFVISAGTITREAQNSLLKIFEEPTEGTHFFLVMPRAETLLPTLRSRLSFVRSLGEKIEKKGDLVSARDFMKLSKAERLTFLTPLVEEVDRQKATAFLDSLEKVIAAEGDLAKRPDRQNFMNELYAMKGYLNDRSSSVKMILEHLALIL